MSDFFKETDCDSTGYYSANEVERISGVRTAGPTISLGRANALIKERGTVVYGSPEMSDRQWLTPLTENNVPIGSSHTALLINIEPLEKDSAEKIANDLADYKFDHEVGLRFEIASLKHSYDDLHAYMEKRGVELFKLRAKCERLERALKEISEIEHHEHTQIGRAVMFARQALSGDAE